MYKKIFLLFKVVVILNLLLCLVRREWIATFICLFNFALFFIADYLQSKIYYNHFIKVLIYIFLIFSLVGGEVYYLYNKIWYFDIFLHTLSSFIVSGLFLYLCKFLGFYGNKILLILCIFSFAMMVAALWEITEFSIDRIFGTDMQKDTIVTDIDSVLLSSDGISVVNKKISRMSIGDYSIDGYLDIGLYDTIGDMMCAIAGSMIYIIFSKKKLLI